jgi:hypothetical protein
MTRVGDLKIVCLVAIILGGIMMTSFDPRTRGFHFSNTFATQPLFDIRFSGLCGGMSYAALDYFNAGQVIPRQGYRPANGSELFAYIKNRQGTSLERNVDKWLELGFNPFGSRTGEFFNWGIQGFNGGRLQELRTEIDAGRPAALGLFAAGDGGFSNHHHQVIAIGYDLGRYTGDLGAHKEDLRIFICDPNFPQQTMVLRPHPESNRYVYDGMPDCNWLTYFVDRKYSAAAPPTISTGRDDLRGGNDNISATVTFRTRPAKQFPNLNNSQRWIGSYSETVQISLSPPVDIEEISSVVFTTAFGGGLGGDNWNVDCIRICAVVGDSATEIFKATGSPLVRFTGSVHTFEAVIPVRTQPGTPGRAVAFNITAPSSATSEQFELNHPSLNNDPNWIVTATLQYQGEGYHVVDKFFGVYYVADARKWVLQYFEAGQVLSGRKFSVIALRP